MQNLKHAVRGAKEEYKHEEDNDIATADLEKPASTPRAHVFSPNHQEASLCRNQLALSLPTSTGLRWRLPSSEHARAERNCINVDTTRSYAANHRCPDFGTAPIVASRINLVVGHALVNGLWDEHKS